MNIIHSSKKRTDKKSRLGLKNLLAVLSILAVLLAPIIGSYFDGRSNGDAPDPLLGRVKAVIGYWEGSVTQEFHENSTITAAAVVRFTRVEGATLKGHVDYVYQVEGKPIHERFHLSGTLVHGNLLKMEYHSADASIKQLGSGVMELNPTGKILRGKFAGFGARSNRIITGSFHLEKKA